VNPTGLYRTGGGIFIASVQLPAGAIVSALEFAGYDANATENLSLSFNWTQKINGLSLDHLPALSTTGSSGWQVVSAPPFTPWTVDNNTYSYVVYVAFGAATDSSLILGSVRVGYKLQISPDPATATFADVPVGHPFHRFVEALYASGITGGCGGGNYCPDAPVTRGQMAVFLAGALGLHWAP